MISRKENSNFVSDFFKASNTKGMKKVASKKYAGKKRARGIEDKGKAIEILNKFLKSEKIKDGYVQSFIDKLNDATDSDVSKIIGDFFKGLNSAKKSESARRRISATELRARVLYGNFVRISKNDDLYQDSETDDLWVVEGSSVKRLFKEEKGIAIF